MFGVNRTALTAATTIADALADPQILRHEPLSGRARPQSLAGGAVGIALLHIERARTGHGDEARVHAWLTHAASEPISAGPNANLFHGAPALGFALHTAAMPRYRRALAALDDKTTTLTRTRLATAHARIGRGDRLQMREFDLIHGLTGLGVYHLHRHPTHPITGEVISYLTRLTQSPGGTDDLPPWWMPVGLSGEPDSDFPLGHGNLGIAHGISAVLALLSLAILHDIPTASLQDAVARLCGWTDQWRTDEPAGTWWPGYLTIEQARSLAPPHRPRPSWCYGISGTARAQQLAGLALGDTARQHAAEAAILATLRNPAQLALLPGIGLCHGQAGLLQSALRTAVDARNTAIAAELPDVATHLSAQLAQPITDPELMDGAAGAALALHAFGTGATPVSPWDAVLLLG
ncbi:lanthionine synthetase C family protein [Micromonospora sp. NPDC049903]|uniref:lanthionine synthetase C family protein n=1 Tax=Micromonospora sp. NPDC049903 TaxID=3364276 RepID=UPI0037A2499A